MSVEKKQSAHRWQPKLRYRQDPGTVGHDERLGERMTPDSQQEPDAAGGLAALLHGRGTLLERMGIEVTHAEADQVTASMPVQGNTQPYGLLHGGASAVLAETVGSVAAALHAGRDRIAVGVDLNCTHHRAVRAGRVHAVAEPLHRGGSVATYAIAITDDDGAAVCSSRLTCLLRPANGANQKERQTEKQQERTPAQPE